MALYRTRPDFVEATRYTGGAVDATRVIDWLLDYDVTASYHEQTVLPAHDPEDVWAMDGKEFRAEDVVDPEHILIQGSYRLEPGQRDWVVLTDPAEPESLMVETMTDRDFRDHFIPVSAADRSPAEVAG